MKATTAPRYTATRLPNAAVCFDCRAEIPARVGSYRLVDKTLDYPVSCRPWRHSEPPEGLR